MKLQESVYFILNKLKESGTDKLSIDENGYLKITDMYYKTPSDAGYVTDSCGNFIHSRTNSNDYWGISDYNGNSKVKIYFEDNTSRLDFQYDTLTLVNPEIDVTKSNNNISAVKYPSNSVITDTNGKILSRVEGVVNPNGNVGFYIYANNYNSSGTEIGRAGIQGYVDKNGNVSYGVNSPDKFRQAIGTFQNCTTVQGTNDEITQTGNVAKTVITMQHTTKTGYFFVMANVVLKTSRFTSSAQIWLDGKPVGYQRGTNLTTPITVNPIAICGGMNANTTHTLTLVITAQDSGTTATIPSYNAPQMWAFDLLK